MDKDQDNTTGADMLAGNDSAEMQKGSGQDHAELQEAEGGDGLVSVAKAKAMFEQNPGLVAVTTDEGILHRHDGLLK